MLVLLLTVACMSSAPTLASDTPPTLRVPAPRVGELSSMSEVIAVSRLINGAAAPSSITPPFMTNYEAVLEFIRERFPESSASEPPLPFAWVFVSETGEPHVSGLVKSTNDPALDSLAIATAKQARFKPASIAGVPVSLWIPVAIPIGRGSPPGERITPYTIKPELLNKDEVSRRLLDYYPPALRAQRVGGEILLWVLVDERGRVVKSVVKRRAADNEFNSAAQHVARGMKFTPARNHDRPVAVWIQIPIVFKVM